MVELSPLGDVCKTTSGGTPSRSKPHYFAGTIPWVKSGELPDGMVIENSEYISDEAISNSSAKLLPAGTLLVALYGATVGKLGILSRPAATNQAVCAIFPSEAIDTKFLFWYLLAKRPWLIGQAAGGAQPNISQGVIRSLMVPVMPLAAQHEIVAEIEKQFSRLDEAVANLKRVKANLKRYKASVLKDAVEGRLVPTEAELARREGRSFETGEQLLRRILATRRSSWNGRGKFVEPRGPNAAPTRLPEGWVAPSIPQIATIASGNTPAGILDAVQADGEMPWFKVGDMNHHENLIVMRHADAWLSISEVQKLGLRVFPAQTVLFPKRGGAIATNKKRLLDEQGCADLNVMGITPAEEVADYFFNWFDSVDLAKLSDGSNVPQINNKDIEPLAVPLPPLAEQKRIVAEAERRLSLVRNVEIEVDANLKRAQALRQSTLATAFCGSC